MMGHMFGYGFGNGWFGNSWIWLIAMGLIRLLLIVGVVVLIVKLLKNNSHHSYNSYSRPDKSLEILKERYAKGEIDEEEYKRKKRILDDK